MKTNQKVRVMRRLGRMLIDQHAWESWEMQAFGAPSECWDLIGKRNQKTVLKVFEQLDIELIEFFEEVDRQIEIEAQFTPEYEVPWAHYELAEVTEIIEDGCLECQGCLQQKQEIGAEKEGWKITPSFDLPEGFELREDEDFLYLYQGHELVAVYSSIAYTSTEEIRTRILIDCRYAV